VLVAGIKTLAVLSVEPLSTINSSAVIESGQTKASKLAIKRLTLEARLKVGTITLMSNVLILHPPQINPYPGQ
jgi:hypothetical protein